MQNFPTSIIGLLHPPVFHTASAALWEKKDYSLHIHMNITASCSGGRYPVSPSQMDSNSAVSSSAERRSRAGDNELCGRKKKKRMKRPDWESCPFEPEKPSAQLPPYSGRSYEVRTSINLWHWSQLVTLILYRLKRIQGKHHKQINIINYTCNADSFKVYVHDAKSCSGNLPSMLNFARKKFPLKLVHSFPFRLIATLLV